jgi:hypothetical protein
MRCGIYEKTWSEELPYLFQTLFSGTPRAMSTHTIWRSIHRACEELIPTHPDFAEIRFAIFGGCSPWNSSTTACRFTSEPLSSDTLTSAPHAAKSRSSAKAPSASTSSSSHAAGPSGH